MNEKLKRELRARLESEHERLQIEVDQIAREGHEALSDASGENNYRDHMADQGTATFSRELDMTLEENTRDALTAIHAAIDRIEEGTYGTCERCSNPISDERLQAMPTATLCISCKSAEESR